MNPVGSQDEAIARANAAEDGNAASIFTGSGAAACRFRYEVLTQGVEPRRKSLHQGPQAG